MDQNSIDYCMGVLDEVEAALKPIGMTLERAPLSETSGIPSGMIHIGEGKTAGNWEIICNVVPTHVDEVSTTFVQLYLQLTGPWTQRREELDPFIKGCNEKFMLGSLLAYEDCLCMKYTLALEPTIALENSHFQAAVFTFCKQAEVFTILGTGLRDGKLTIEQALQGRTAEDEGNA